MPGELTYAPLLISEIDELAKALHNEVVYEYIGGLPSRGDFTLGLRRALAGPPPDAAGEYGINYGVRRADTRQLIGRLEATVHDDLAEVALMFDPRFWGQGYASRGLRWLHDHLREFARISSAWATTHPENERSARLLLRCGYTQVMPERLPALYSYDEGDLVFRRGLI